MVRNISSIVKRPETEVCEHVDLANVFIDELIITLVNRTTVHFTSYGRRRCVQFVQCVIPTGVEPLALVASQRANLGTV